MSHSLASSFYLLLSMISLHLLNMVRCGFNTYLLLITFYDFIIRCGYNTQLLLITFYDFIAFSKYGRMWL